MCNHGVERNKRMEAKMDTLEGVTENGRAISVQYAAEEYTISDRFCVTCGDWMPAKGVMGAILCMECHTQWDKCPACGGSNQVPNASGCGEAAGGWADYCDIVNPLPAAQRLEGE